MALAFPRSFPRRGEIYMIDFDPARGSEQAGIRPALVVSNDTNNQHSPTVVVAAITKTIPTKQYPQNVHLPAGVLELAGTIYCTQILTVDKQRIERYRGTLEAAEIEAVNLALAKALALPVPAKPGVAQSARRN